jgi:hypothetical protein
MLRQNYKSLDGGSGLSLNPPISDDQSSRSFPKSMTSRLPPGMSW